VTGPLRRWIGSALVHVIESELVATSRQHSTGAMKPSRVCFEAAQEVRSSSMKSGTCRGSEEKLLEALEEREVKRGLYERRHINVRILPPPTAT